MFQALSWFIRSQRLYSKSLKLSEDSLQVSEDHSHAGTLLRVMHSTPVRSKGPRTHRSEDKGDYVPKGTVD